MGLNNVEANVSDSTYSNSRFDIGNQDISRIMSGSSLSGHEPISMDVEIGEWVTNSRQPMVGVERGRPAN
jgi:hypothetical protein